jgi:hypothetical protein
MGVFPIGFGGAWLISGENFFKVPAITELKIRASYGLTGNFQIANYGSLDLLSANNYVLGAGTGTTNNGVGLSQPANPDLTWEKTSQFNAGLDLGLFRGRIYLSADFIQERHQRPAALGKRPFKFRFCDGVAERRQCAKYRC